MYFIGKNNNCYCNEYSKLFDGLCAPETLQLDITIKLTIK